MANTKKTKTDKKNDKSTKDAGDKSSAKSGGESATSAAKVTRRLLDRLSPIGATTRAALRSLATDAQRSELGRKTKARGVLTDGVAMAISIEQQIGTFPGLTDTYAPRRFAYFLESLLALDALIEGSTTREAKVGAARGTAATAYEKADKARTKLLNRLEAFAGRRTAEIAEIGSVPAKGRTNDDLGRSIAKAVEIARSWLGRKDPLEVEIAAIAALDEAVVTSAVNAAAALGGAHVDAALEGHKTSNDSPVVNLEEGNVLLEMAYAMDMFEEAHDDNDVVRRLIPGPSTRHVLAKSARAAAAPAAEAPKTEAAPASPGAPPAK
jgi:hypothetical protein